MIGRWSTVATFALALTFGSTDARTSVLPSSPVPTQADACATAIPNVPNDVPTAFAYDLTSPDMLRLLGAVAGLARRDQQRAFDAAADAAGSPPEHAAAAALAVLCPNLDEVYATTRALALVSNRWQIAGLSDPARFAAFGAVTETALWALSAGDRLAPELRQAALQPFAALGALASPPPDLPSAASSDANCRRPDRDARPIRQVGAGYPEHADDSTTSGTVLVKVSLSETGAVRNARIVSNTLHRRAGSESLIREAIFAAAASTYAPASSGCRPAASVYFAEYSFPPRSR